MELARTVPEVFGVSEELLAIKGTIATAVMHTACEMDGELSREGFAFAEKEFDYICRHAEQWGLKRMLVSARVQQCLCLRESGREMEAAQRFEELLKSDFGELRKAEADAYYNYGCVLEDLGRSEDAIIAFDEAAKRYIVIGDSASEDDARARIRELVLPH